MEYADMKIRKVFNSKKLTKSQLNVLKKLYNEDKARGLKPNTTANKLLSIEKFGLFLKKSYDKANKQDLINFFSEINDHYKEGSLNTFKVHLKLFYKWLRNTKDYPKEVEWIKRNRSNDGKLPEELLSPEDVKKLVNYSPSKKAKAIVMLLYDGALRVGELVNLKLKNLIFDEYGGYITIPKGKTGMRKLRLVDSIPYLKEYINSEHYCKDNSNSFLFLSNKTKDPEIHLKTQSIGKLLTRIEKMSKLNKNVYPHIFRHSKLTEMAKEFTEQELKVFAGWSKGSSMASVYVHLSEEDVGKKLLENRGLIKEKDKIIKNRLQPRICIDPSCGYENPVTAKFCSRCHRPLDVKTIENLDKSKENYEDSLKDLIMNNDKVKDILLKALIEKGVKFD